LVHPETTVNQIYAFIADVPGFVKLIRREFEGDERTEQMAIGTEFWLLQSVWMLSCRICMVCCNLHRPGRKPNRRRRTWRI